VGYFVSIWKVPFQYSAFGYILSPSFLVVISLLLHRENAPKRKLR